MMKRLVSPIALLILLAAVCQWGLSNENPLPAEPPEQDFEIFLYNAHGKRNPFIPLILPKEESILPTPTPEPLLVAMSEAATPTPTPIMFPGIEVDCILWFEDRPSLVVIDNVLLGVGDTVDECEILEIHPDSIRVRFMEQEKVVPVVATESMSVPRKGARRRK